MATVKVLGVTDEVTSCECCGKRNLKRTVALDLNGETVHYGVDCAARALNVAGTFSAKTAEKFVAAARQTLADRDAFEAAKVEAQDRAAATGQEMVVVKDRNGFSIQRAAAYYSRAVRNGSVRFTAAAA